MIKKENNLSDWLPITKKEMELRGWDSLDVIIISGDAYVDHPSFGAAVIARLVESEGLRVGIVPQPNWRDDLRDFKKLGKPNLFFGVTGGCMDSMVNHYTAAKRKRSNDAYTPGGEAGYRPDYATVVYTKILKELYPEVPVLIGGIEASLRRVTHYDYWSDQLKPSILQESGADILVYGMGEQPLKQIIKLVAKGVPMTSLKTIQQTAILQPIEEDIPKGVHWTNLELKSHEECLEDKIKFASNFKFIERESNKQNADRLIQNIGNKRLVINPPYKTMKEKEIDASFDLPYTRLPHPKYANKGPIPAFDMIKFSINMHRGCFGGCSFCTISAHQGKMIASRSEGSIIKEINEVTKMPDFKGYLSDLGGPSANMYKMKGKVQSICDRCVSPSCIHPVVCDNLDSSHKAMTQLYRKVDKIPEIKKAFVSSGIRYDLLVSEYNKADETKSLNEYMEQVVTRHIPGRLKVAPEHTSDPVLRIMRKPSFKYFHMFKKKFEQVNKKHGLKQPLIPYFISSHPGCEMQDMANLALETKEMGFQLEQVQDFTPTPMTVATVIYYSGVHPYTLKPVNTVKDPRRKKDQNKFFFWYKKENQAWIRDTLRKTGNSKMAEELLTYHAKMKKDERDQKKNPSAKSKFSSTKSSTTTPNGKVKSRSKKRRK
ncbi:YgiQ family radical SAM protein [Flammeovirga kamogawensis]|uniref:YgiQ family radical SAM protein n=1 Tax=Flammeovirga kamogawensis TaxID=373891 RepID=A0ABX8GV82_9BACT|nr:YgiQ family radical SAM protein [Flammeovirga kamogawensis]MBB6459618.1 putative radical SAM protein YgiQ [Flammeovirga kamogawensis]QWG07319.1 YgiQ family radical SAM protein [Flammeovirga kamogawensis]TRX69136.1 YgiQ family radical SAM protein [Flammeovirga kamogawensis]